MDGCSVPAGLSRARTVPGSQFACGPPPIFLVSIGYLEVNKPNKNHRIRIIFGNLFTYNKDST